jgi:hypothetical protein
LLNASVHDILGFIAAARTKEVGIVICFVARAGGLCSFVALAASVRLDALKAAGLKGVAPSSGAGAFQQLIGTLTDNWKWLIATGVGLVLVLVAGLMIAGSQRAPDHFFRVIGGIMLILVVIPAVLA